jgi:hypothetical protein
MGRTAEAVVVTVRTVPEEFVGAWVRRSISLGGAPHAEWEDVVWIQADEHFADLRLPRAGATPPDGVAPEPWSFSGTTTWDPPTLTWHHSLDTRRVPGSGDPLASDHGDVVWRTGDPSCGELVETGHFGDVPYEEVWVRRVAPCAGDVLVLERPDGRGRLVRVGDHSIVVCDDRPAGGFAARYDQWDGAEWVAVRTLGSPDGLPTPADPGEWMPPARVPVAADQRGAGG